MLFSVKLLHRFDDTSNKDFNALLIRSVLDFLQWLALWMKTFDQILPLLKVGAIYMVHFCDFIFVY